jgi:SAM-dependent methyltransferase
MKLHLGAFDAIHPGWLNTDITPHIAIARVPGLWRVLEAAGLLDQRRAGLHRSGVFRQLRRLDVKRRFPFVGGAVDAIHISHMLSNLERENAERCLAECFRVLKPGGVLRIGTVDLDAAVAGYRPAAADDFMNLIFDLDCSTRAKNRHWWHYNERSLGDRLRKAGFQQVYRCQYRQGRCPDVETIDNRPGSLFLEAIR